jgi:hypothetical protein
VFHLLQMDFFWGNMLIYSIGSVFESFESCF